MKPKKIIIFDTEDGSGINQKYINMLPGVKITGMAVDGKRLGVTHPHGRMCGYLAGAPLTLQAGKWEIIFARIFNKEAQFINDAELWMLDVIQNENPNIISCSIGQWDQDSELGEMMGQVFWGDWSERFLKLKDTMKFIDFWAAGNSDDNDKDDDIDYPQFFCGSHIIGACDRKGVPAKFSGDGEGLECLLWGVQRYLNDNGVWVLGSGTSFSCPAAAGLCAYHGFNNDKAWLKYVKEHVSIPTDWERGKKSKKFGYGTLEDEYQKVIADVGSYLPSFNTLNINGVDEWFGFKKVV
jgi:hypothetical protein